MPVPSIEKIVENEIGARSGEKDFSFPFADWACITVTGVDHEQTHLVSGVVQDQITSIGFSSEESQTSGYSGQRDKRTEFASSLSRSVFRKPSSDGVETKLADTVFLNVYPHTAVSTDLIKLDLESKFNRRNLVVVAFDLGEPALSFKLLECIVQILSGFGYNAKILVLCYNFDLFTRMDGIQKKLVYQSLRWASSHIGAGVFCVNLLSRKSKGYPVPSYLYIRDFISHETGYTNPSIEISTDVSSEICLMPRSETNDSFGIPEYILKGGEEKDGSSRWKVERVFAYWEEQYIKLFEVDFSKNFESLSEEPQVKLLMDPLFEEWTSGKIV